MAKAVDEFRKYLRKSKLLLTPQRELILREVLQLNEHFDAEELYERLRGGGSEVSRATVYRTLPYLERSGLIREVFRCQKRAKYERVAGHHDHMLCTRCGKVIEFRDDGIKRLQEKVCRKHGFRPIEHRMGIKGICRECQKNDAKEGR